jgi:hypothetical protein
MKSEKFNPVFLEDNFYWEYALGIKKPEDLCGWLLEQGLTEEEAIEINEEVHKLEEERGLRLKTTETHFIAPADSVGRKEFESNW